MKPAFFLEHENSKLLQLSILQAFVILSVFALFFYSVGFTFLFAVLAGFIGYLAIACIYRWMNLPFFILPMIKGAVYIPTSQKDIQTMLKLSAVKKGDAVVDLGSGDGRVVAAFAKAGAKVVGLELTPSLVSKAEQLLAREHITNAKILWENFWDVNLHDYDLVVVYGYPTIMKRLQNKLRKELRPGTKVISNQFPFSGWTPAKQEDGVFLYIIE